MVGVMIWMMRMTILNSGGVMLKYWWHSHIYNFSFIVSWWNIDDILTFIIYHLSCHDEILMTFSHLSFIIYHVMMKYRWHSHIYHLSFIVSWWNIDDILTFIRNVGNSVSRPRLAKSIYWKSTSFRFRIRMGMVNMIMMVMTGWFIIMMVFMSLL